MGRDSIDEDPEITRRDAMLGAGLMAGALLFAIPASIILTKIDEHEGKKPPLVYKTDYELFGGEVLLTRTETLGRSIFGNSLIGLSFDFDIKRPGEYRFDGLVQRFRMGETKEEEWKYNVSAPMTFRENPSNLVRRIEAHRIVDGRQENDGTGLQNYNFSGNSITMAGGQI